MEVDSLEITLKTVTPVWTGGADGKSGQLNLTGIIGNLRWWYEVMVRSVGGHVCDPTTHNANSCLYDKDKQYDGLCDVCRIFGATGWSRRFRIVISKNSLQQKKPAESSDNASGRVFNLSRNHSARYTQEPRWYLNGDPLSGQVTLKIIPTAPVNKTEQRLFDSAIIGALIQFIADRGSIGAKPQMGLGVVQVVNRQSTKPLIDYLAQIVAEHRKEGDLRTLTNDELPCLQNMFFTQIHVHSGLASATFDLKYDLRNMLRKEFVGDSTLRHTIMGYVRGNDREGAKIMMSYPYENEIVRIWGWIPGLTHSVPSRDNILNHIYAYLRSIDRADKIPFWYFIPEEDSNVLQYLEDCLMIGVE